MSNIIVGLDIGTAFVKVVIGELDENNAVSIIGFAKKPSHGLRNGVIVNIDAAAAAIKDTIEAAEQVAGVEVTSVYTAIGGPTVESMNSEGTAVVDTSNRARTLPIDDDVVRRAIESAMAVQLALGKQGLCCIPQKFFVDDLEGTKNPLRIEGKKLKVKVHIIQASETACNNIERCIAAAGYDYPEEFIVSKTLAASKASIHSDEQDLGSILIDMGAGTTDIMIVNEGAPVFMASIPVGGNHVTNDISVIKGLPTDLAEKIKVESGCCWIFGSESDEDVIIPGIGGRPPEEITRYELCQIIQPRVDEIFSMAKKEIIQHAKISQLNGSIILTGGGANMPGVVELAQSVWGTSSVRIGEQSDFGNLDKSYRCPDYATAIGIILTKKDSERYVKQKTRSSRIVENKEKKPSLIKNLSKNLFKNLF